MRLAKVWLPALQHSEKVNVLSEVVGGPGYNNKGLQSGHLIPAVQSLARMISMHDTIVEQQ